MSVAPGRPSVVKVDDTAPGVAEGRAAGCWVVGVTVSGNAVGLPLPQWQALLPDEQNGHRRRAVQQLEAAGAHETVDSIAELPAALGRLAARVAAGEGPEGT